MEISPHYLCSPLHINIIPSYQRNSQRNGPEVLQHHHLAVLTEKDFDDKDVLISESWQAPVVTTTLTNCFALFLTAQDTVRMPAMESLSYY